MKNSFGHIEAVGCEGKFPRSKGSVQPAAELLAPKTLCLGTGAVTTCN